MKVKKKRKKENTNRRGSFKYLYQSHVTIRFQYLSRGEEAISLRIRGERITARTERRGDAITGKDFPPSFPGIELLLSHPIHVASLTFGQIPFRTESSLHSPRPLILRHDPIILIVIEQTRYYYTRRYRVKFFSKFLQIFDQLLIIG